MDYWALAKLRMTDTSFKLRHKIWHAPAQISSATSSFIMNAFIGPLLPASQRLNDDILVEIYLWAVHVNRCQFTYLDSPVLSYDAARHANDVVKCIQDARSACLRFASLNRSWNERAIPRLFQIMALWDCNSLKMDLPCSILRAHCEGALRGSLVQRLDLCLTTLSTETAIYAAEGVRLCSNLTEFSLIVVSGNIVDVHFILRALGETAGLSLRQLHCYLPDNISQHPLVYLEDFDRLQDCSLGAAHMTIPPQPLPSSAFRAIGPFHFRPGCFDSLKSLRVYRADILTRLLESSFASLTALRVDFRLPYDVIRVLIPFLKINGPRLRILDIYYTKVYKFRIFKLCPNLHTLVLDIGGITPMLRESTLIVLSALRCVGIRGAFAIGVDQGTVSSSIIHLIRLFVRKAQFPVLRQIQLLDLPAPIFYTLRWDAHVARNWFFCLVDCWKLNVEVLDCRGHSLTRRIPRTLGNRALMAGTN